MSALRLHVIACRVFERELEVLAKDSKSELFLHFVEIGLHQQPAAHLNAALQEAVNTVPEEDFDVVALAYGLCNRGLIGLRAHTLPVVIPRAHDCLSLLLGSSARYLAEFGRIGTYFQSSGWMEHLPADNLLRPLASETNPELAADQQSVLARYGEENLGFLREELKKIMGHYERLGFITTPVPGIEAREKLARKIAAERGWQFEIIPGNLGWLGRMLNGQWSDHEFLTLQPGQRVAQRYDAQLIGVETL